jgi:hypothetical protein
MSTVFWENPDNKNAVVLTKEDGTKMIIAIGDFISYKERIGGVRVDHFTHINNGPPIGMVYLPWREKEKRWASLSFGVKGNHRHIITPNSYGHYGEHINWDTIENLGQCPVE